MLEPVVLSRVIHPHHWYETKIRSCSRLIAAKSRDKYILYKEVYVANSESLVECFELVQNWVIYFLIYDASKCVGSYFVKVCMCMCFYQE